MRAQSRHIIQQSTMAFELTRKQSEPAHLCQGHVVRQVAAPYSVWQRFPLCPLKAMLTKISKWSRIQYSFWITPKIESLVVFAVPDIPRKFQKDPSITFWVILLTHRGTNKQTKSGKNITFLGEVIIPLYSAVVPYSFRGAGRAGQLAVCKIK